MRTGNQGFGSGGSYRPQAMVPNHGAPRVGKGEPPKKKVVDSDIHWITPTRLAVVFLIGLVVTLYFNGV